MAMVPPEDTKTKGEKVILKVILQQHITVDVLTRETFKKSNIVYLFVNCISCIMRINRHL